MNNNHLLLNAAFAGLALSSAEAVTVYDENSRGDLSDLSGSPTDLTSTFSDFLSDSGVIGSLAFTNDANSEDFSDNFLVQAHGKYFSLDPFLV